MKQPLVLAFIGISACTIHVDDDYRRSGRFSDAKWAGSNWGECRDHNDCAGDCYCSEGQCAELPFCRRDGECPVGAFCSRRLGRCVLEDVPTTTSGGDESSNGDTFGDETAQVTSTPTVTEGGPSRNGDETLASGEGVSDDTSSSHEQGWASDDTSAGGEATSLDDTTAGGDTSAGGEATSFDDTQPAEFTNANDSGATGYTSDDPSNEPPLPADAGTACNHADASGECLARPAVCFASDDCDDGLCVNAQCRSFCEASSDCPASEACVLGLCRRLDALECTVKADCPETDDCVSGSCVRRCLSNGDCEQCDDGPTCRNGYCGPQ